MVIQITKEVELRGVVLSDLEEKVKFCFALNRDYRPEFVSAICDIIKYVEKGEIHTDDITSVEWGYDPNHRGKTIKIKIKTWEKVNDIAR
jgi:hypothetical protein